MLQIAICDSDRLSLDMETLVVSDYWKKRGNGIEYCIDSYENAEDFLAAGKRCDILVTDYCPAEGLAGPQIRKRMKGQECFARTAIIYCTAHPEYMQEAFGVNVCGYLLKPLDYEKVEQSMKPIVDELLDWYCLYIMGRKLDLRQVMYIQSDDQYVHVVTKEESILWREKMYRLEDQLPSHDFMRIHKSAYINFSFVDHIDEKVHMRDRTVLPVSRAIKKELLERYRRYLRDKE